MAGIEKACTNNRYKESTLQSLLERSIKAKEHSHSPYSKFRVGAALLTDTGEIIDGCNVENASYGLTICAERTALVKAVSMGFKKFPAIAITTDMEQFIAPCGACRQVIAEFGLECDVYLVKSDLSYTKMSVSELLPLAFTAEDLEKASEKK
ncbi:cytidine deaminase-like [Oculina patagonica]